MHQSSVRHRLAAVALAPLLVGGLAACNSSDAAGTAASDTTSSSSTSASSGVSAGASASAGSAVASGSAVSTAGFRRTLQHSLDGATTARLALRFASSGTSLTGTGKVDYTGRTPALALDVNVPSLGGKAEIRVVGQVLYVGLPTLDPGTFYRVDLNKPGGPLGQLGAITAFDPQTTLTRLSQTIRSVSDDGLEKLAGTAVRHYTVIADTSRLASASPSATTPSLPASITYEVWIDDASHRLYQVETTPTAGTDVVVTLSDWGSPVSIQAPPASSVKEMPAGGIS